jgi:ABC-type transporter Mla subunit MlaD
MNSVEDLEARIAHLEDLEAQRRDLTLDSRLQATSYGLGLVHADTQAIRSELSDFRVEVDQRFHAVDQRFIEVNERFNAVDQRFIEVNERLDGLGGNLAEVNQRLDDFGGSIAEILSRLPDRG